VIRRNAWCVPIASAELDQGLVCGQAAEGLVAGDGERVYVGELVVEGQQPRVAQQTQGVVVIGARSAREVSAALIELERHEGAVVHQPLKVEQVRVGRGQPPRALVRALPGLVAEEGGPPAPAYAGQYGTIRAVARSFDPRKYAP
jgi:hypothetical protein